MRKPDAESQASEEQFRTLVRELSGPLLRFAAGILRDADAAHDVVQTALLRVWKRQGQWDAASAKGYCYRAVRNEALSQIRNRRLRDRHEQEASRMAETELNPEPSTAAREAWQEALKLPAELREPLVLHYAHGLTVSEVAEATDTPRGTIATRLRRALESLRGSLLAVPAFTSCDLPELESALHSAPEHASDVLVSNTLIHSLEAAVMAGIATKGAWSAGTIIVLIMFTLLVAGGAIFAFGDWSEDAGNNRTAKLDNAAFDDNAARNRNHAAPANKPENKPLKQTPVPPTHPEKHPSDVVPQVPPPLKPQAEKARQIGPVRVTIGGMVVDAGKWPVPHADVTIYELKSFRDHSGPQVAQVQTNSDGVFKAEFTLPPRDKRIAHSYGMIGIGASSHGLQCVRMLRSIVGWYAGERTQARDGFVLQVSEPRRTTIHVTDEDGEPVPGAHVWWRQSPNLMGFGADSAGPETSPGGTALEFTSDAAGRVEAVVPHASELQAVQVFADGFVSSYRTLSTAECDAGKPIEIKLERARPQLSIVVKDSQGNPLGDRKGGVSFKADSGRYYLEAQLSSRMATDNAGEFTIDSAPQGDVEVTVWVDGYTHEVVQLSRDSRRVSVTLRRWNQVTLRFQDEDGELLTPRSELLHSRDENFSRAFDSGSGTLTISWKGEADTVDVKVAFYGWTKPAELKVSRSAGAEQTITVARPDSDHLLHVQVLTAQGEPAAGAELYYSQQKPELGGDAPMSVHYPAVRADGLGRFTLRLDGMAFVWLCASRRKVYSAQLRVELDRGEKSVTLKLIETTSLHVTFSRSLAAARPYIVVQNPQGRVIGLWASVSRPVSEAEIKNLPEGPARVTLMTMTSLVAPYDGDPYVYPVENKAGDDNRLDLGSVLAEDVTVKLTAGGKPLRLDDFTKLMLIRIGPKDDPSKWTGITHVLQSDMYPPFKVDADSKCELKLLPGRYFFLLTDYRTSNSSGAVFEVTDRSVQEVSLDLVKSGG